MRPNTRPELSPEGLRVAEMLLGVALVALTVKSVVDADWLSFVGLLIVCGVVALRDMAREHEGRTRGAPLGGNPR